MVSPIELQIPGTTKYVTTPLLQFCESCNMVSPTELPILGTTKCAVCV